MSDLQAHSITEAQLYCMLQTCAGCQAGSLETIDESIEQQHIDSVIRLDCRCRACAAEQPLRFRIDSKFATPVKSPLINPTDRPSAIIDAAQWLTLQHTLLARAAAAASKPQTLRFRILAGLCIEEALKFYEADNDLPPASAFFTEQARQNALRYPELFARSVLLAHRARLPHPSPSSR